METAETPRLDFHLSAPNQTSFEQCSLFVLSCPHAECSRSDPRFAAAVKAVVERHAFRNLRDEISARG